jgi:hypothetical protein
MDISPADSTDDDPVPSDREPVDDLLDDPLNTETEPELSMAEEIDAFPPEELDNDKEPPFPETPAPADISTRPPSNPAPDIINKDPDSVVGDTFDGPTRKDISPADALFEEPLSIETVPDDADVLDALAI